MSSQKPVLDRAGSTVNLESSSAVLPTQPLNRETVPNMSVMNWKINNLSHKNVHRQNHLNYDKSLNELVPPQFQPYLPDKIRFIKINTPQLTPIQQILLSGNNKYAVAKRMQLRKHSKSHEKEFKFTANFTLAQIQRGKTMRRNAENRANRKKRSNTGQLLQADYTDDEEEEAKKQFEEQQWLDDVVQPITQPATATSIRPNNRSLSGDSNNSSKTVQPGINKTKIRTKNPEIKPESSEYDNKKELNSLKRENAAKTKQLQSLLDSYQPVLPSTTANPANSGETSIGTSSMGSTMSLNGSISLPHGTKKFLQAHAGSNSRFSVSIYKRDFPGENSAHNNPNSLISGIIRAGKNKTLLKALESTQTSTTGVTAVHEIRKSRAVEEVFFDFSSINNPPLAINTAAATQLTLSNLHWPRLTRRKAVYTALFTSKIMEKLVFSLFWFIFVKFFQNRSNRVQERLINDAGNSWLVLRATLELIWSNQIIEKDDITRLVEEFERLQQENSSEISQNRSNLDANGAKPSNQSANRGNNKSIALFLSSYERLQLAGKPIQQRTGVEHTKNRFFLAFPVILSDILFSLLVSLFPNSHHLLNFGFQLRVEEEIYYWLSGMQCSQLTLDKQRANFMRERREISEFLLPISAHPAANPQPPVFARTRSSISAPSLSSALSFTVDSQERPELNGRQALRRRGSQANQENHGNQFTSTGDWAVDERERREQLVRMQIRAEKQQILEEKARTKMEQRELLIKQSQFYETQRERAENKGKNLEEKELDSLEKDLAAGISGIAINKSILATHEEESEEEDSLLPASSDFESQEAQHSNFAADSSENFEENHKYSTEEAKELSHPLVSAQTQPFLRAPLRCLASGRQNSASTAELLNAELLNPLQRELLYKDSEERNPLLLTKLRGESKIVNINAISPLLQAELHRSTPTQAWQQYYPIKYEKSKPINTNLLRQMSEKSAGKVKKQQELQAAYENIRNLNPFGTRSTQNYDKSKFMKYSQSQPNFAHRTPVMSAENNSGAVLNRLTINIQGNLDAPYSNLASGANTATATALALQQQMKKAKQPGAKQQPQQHQSVQEALEMLTPRTRKLVAEFTSNGGEIGFTSSGENDGEEIEGMSEISDDSPRTAAVRKIKAKNQVLSPSQRHIGLRKLQVQHY
jgi:hypothetical protein